MNILDQYRNIGEFSAYGGVVSVTAGAGYGSTAPIVLVTRTIPAQANAHVEALMLKLVDLAISDQLYFSFRFNGVPAYPWDNIPAEQIVNNPIVPINQVFNYGVIEIVARNRSGTTETGASAESFDIRAQASIIGYQARGIPRGGRGPRISGAPGGGVRDEAVLASLTGGFAGFPILGFRDRSSRRRSSSGHKSGGGRGWRWG